jgi:hypothetical protein
MKKFAIAVVAALVAASAFAEASGVGNSYIIINGTWFDAGGDSQGYFEKYNGQSFSGSSLTIGGELTVWTLDDASTWGDTWGGNYMGYSFWDGDTKIGGDDPETHGDHYVNLTKVDGGNDWIKIQNDPGIAADISGLTEGKTYGLQVFFGGVDSKWDSGNNYTASFTKTAVPEPATMSLLGLGALAMVIRRKLSK